MGQASVFYGETRSTTREGTGGDVHAPAIEFVNEQTGTNLTDQVILTCRSDLEAEIARAFLVTGIGMPNSSGGIATDQEMLESAGCEHGYRSAAHAVAVAATAAGATPQKGV